MIWITGKMFKEVDAWRESGLTKRVFLKDKKSTLTKYNYWIVKYKEEPRLLIRCKVFRK